MEALLVVLFFWLFFKAVGLAFRMAWGMAKLIALVMICMAVPLLVLCLLFAGGAALLLPVAVAAVSFGLLARCI